MPVTVEVSSEKATFYGKARYGGVKGSSIILTIPKDIVEVMKLNNKQYLRVTIEKKKLE